MYRILFVQSGWLAHAQHLWGVEQQSLNKQTRQTPTTTPTKLSNQFSASPKKFVINLPTAPQMPAININRGWSKFNPAMNNDPAAMESPKTRKRFGVGLK